MTPTREQDHCAEHSTYLANCDNCFDTWLAHAEVRTQGYEAICGDIDAVLATLAAPSFDYEWSVAPHEMKRTTEKDCAEFWWLRGRQAGKDEGLQVENANLKQMSLMMKGRLQ